MTTIFVQGSHVGSIGSRARLRRLVTRCILLLLLWQERSAQRRQLTGMDSRVLKDMGMTQADVDDEARKPFWRG